MCVKIIQCAKGSQRGGVGGLLNGGVLFNIFVFMLVFFWSGVPPFSWAVVNNSDFHRLPNQRIDTNADANRKRRYRDQCRSMAKLFSLRSVHIENELCVR